MGSIISMIDDELDSQQWKEDKKWIENLSEKIKEIKPRTSEFRDIEWLMNNKEKILGNRKLIDILR